jgi:hypothetical protein
MMIRGLVNCILQSILLLLLLGLSACNLFEATPVQSILETSPIENEAAQADRDPSVTSPVALPTLHSPPTATNSEVENEANFSIIEPLMGGQTVVEGTGPRGTGIFVVDITMMAEPLGSGIIQNDGTFVIDVQPPLSEGHFIGIMIGQLEDQEITPNFFDQYRPYAGDGVRDMPNLGTMWDTAEVIPSN